MDKYFLCKICILLILSFLIYKCFFTKKKYIIEKNENEKTTIDRLEGGSFDADLIRTILDKEQMDKDDIDSLYTCTKDTDSSGKTCYGSDNNPECGCSLKNYDEAYNYILEKLYINKIVGKSNDSNLQERAELARQKGIDALKRLFEGFPDELPTNEGWINTENANTESWYGEKGALYSGKLNKTSEGSSCKNEDTCSLGNDIAEGPFCETLDGKKEYCSFEHLAFSVPEGIEYLRKGLEALYLQENMSEEEARKRSEVKIKDRLDSFKKKGIIHQSVSIPTKELIRSDSGEIGYKDVAKYVPKQGFKIEYTELMDSLYNKYSPEAEMRLLKKELKELKELKGKDDVESVDTMTKDELINMIVELETFYHEKKYTLAGAKKFVKSQEAKEMGIKAFTINAPLEDIMSGKEVMVKFTDITTVVEDPEWNSYISVEGDIDIIGGEGSQEIIEDGINEGSVDEGSVDEGGQQEEISQEEGKQESMVVIMIKGLLVIVIFVSCIAFIMFGLSEYAPETYNDIIYEAEGVIKEIEGVGDDIISEFDDIMDDIKSIGD